jgi:hypothetical protein
VTIKREEPFHDVHIVAKQATTDGMNSHPLVAELSGSPFENSLSFLSSAASLLSCFQHWTTKREGHAGATEEIRPGQTSFS